MRARGERGAPRRDVMSRVQRNVDEALEARRRSARTDTRITGLVHVAWTLALALAACSDDAPPTSDAALPMACASDPDCDDGGYCNGAETCAPGEGADARGCRSGEPPCLDTQRCLSDERRCVTSCAVNADADGDGVEAIECGGADCDDTDADRFPGNTEICDAAGRDEDCDPTTFGDRDADGDGYVDALCCNTDGATMRCGDDCNDQRRDAHPGLIEVCEGVDNDCDGSIDEGLLRMQWPDADRDLHGDEDSEGAMVCPGEPGFSPVRDDCDDTQPTRHRAQLEICDGLDNDCDGLVDEAPVAVPWYPDEDDDGFGTASGVVVISCVPVPGYSTRSSDCNDGDRMINPAARELCNGVDDDCDGLADAPGTGPGDTEDDDGDGFADRVCGGDDCDDANPFVNARAQELCNGIDDDCDGVVDGADASALWYLDRDGDGYGDPDAPAIESCEPQALRVPRAGDCDDSDATVRPGVRDLCDGIDADCDGEIDENGIRFAFFPDADGDGWGTSDVGSVVFACEAPSGTSERTGDCADTDAMRFPSAPERCNSRDDDCDGRTDEAVTETWYVDVDGDGRGAGDPVTTCLPEGLLSAFGDDCAPSDPSRFPGNPEDCNGRDDDCDPNVDESADLSCTRFPNADGSCVAGACVLDCADGFADCDGTLGTGCEVDTDTTASFCGDCATRCAVGDSCGRDTPGTCDVSPVVELAMEGNTVLARRANGSVVVWGASGGGVSGYAFDVFVPSDTSIEDVVEVDPGSNFGCARTRAGRVVCWGDDTYGQLGDGTNASTRPGPAPVPGLSNVVDVATGQFHACAALADGTAWCWGAGNYGQIGHDASPLSVYWAPTQVRRADGTPLTDVVAVHAGQRHSCVLRGPAGARVAECFGQGVNGELGDGGAAQRNHPSVEVVGLPGTTIAFANGTSSPNTCAWTSEGRGYCWGRNSSGLELGTGSSGSVGTATAMPGLTGVVSLSLANFGGCARVSVGGGAFEPWCWGQVQGILWIDGLGGGAQTARRAGLPGSPITDVVAIAGGSSRWCAARSTGGVTCMGSDTNGALGDGGAALSTETPVSVIGLP